MCTHTYLILCPKAETGGGAVGGDGAYYSPAQEEDELYQQLHQQKIKAIPRSHIK